MKPKKRKVHILGLYERVEMSVKERSLQFIYCFPSRSFPRLSINPFTSFVLVVKRIRKKTNLGNCSVDRVPPPLIRSGQGRGGRKGAGGGGTGTLIMPRTSAVKGSAKNHFQQIF